MDARQTELEGDDPIPRVGSGAARAADASALPRGRAFEVDQVPTVQDVARVAAIADPAVRNLEITITYSKLSAALALRTDECSNWCTFATWASRQAGATIRGEDFLDKLQRRLYGSYEFRHPIRSIWRALLRRGLFRPTTRLGRFVSEIHTPFDAFERTSDAVARGNLKVFEEIGHHFARYLAECDRDDLPDSPEFGQFMAGLRRGDPPDGQEYLRRAFTRYQQQRFEPDPAKRAELVALANLEIGLHEQTRLQPEIQESLDAPLSTVKEVRGRVLDAVLPEKGIWRAAFGRGPGAALIVGTAGAMRRHSERLAREVITECLMVLGFPGGAVISLGRPLETTVPDVFLTPSNRELMDFLARFEGTSSIDIGPEDWSELPQRMHFIGRLFCAYHENSDLFLPPFSDDQVAQALAGRLPDGRL